MAQELGGTFWTMLAANVWVPEVLTVQPAATNTIAPIIPIVAVFVFVVFISASTV
jgi:hypothetical protein